MKKIFIIGASVSGMNIFQILSDITAKAKSPNDKYQIEGYIDENPELKGKTQFDKKIFVNFKSLRDKNFSDYYVISAIGDPMDRERLLNKAVSLGFKIDTVIHPSANVSPYAKIGKGVIICQNCLIQPYAEIGDFCYIHAGCVVGPKVKMDYSCTVNSIVAISANTHVERRSYLGVGTSIIQGMKIGEGSILGANSVVVKPIPSHVTAVGIPAKIIKEHPKESWWGRDLWK